MAAPADARKVWQPLHPAIRDSLDPQYVSYHDRYLQYVEPDELTVWDPSLRTKGGLPPGGSKPVPVGSTQDVDLGRFPVRVYTPTGDCDGRGWPVLIWFHGGAWVMGGLASGTDFCTQACQGARCVVVTVGYRLAPENPFPSAVEDAIDAVQWVASAPSELGNVDTSRITIGGTSAGGNLAIVAALAVLNPVVPVPSLPTRQSSPIPHPPISLLLVVPVIDNTATADGVWKPKAETAPWLTASRMVWYRDLVFAREEDRVRWDASPNFAVAGMLRKLPRTWLAVADQDLLGPEALAFAEQIKDLGVSVETVVVEGATHSIMSYHGRIERGRKMVEDAVIHLKEVFNQE